MAPSHALTLLFLLVLHASQSSWGQEGSCHLSEVVINQGQLECKGLLCTYGVTIVNESPVAVHDVHVSCGEFASAALVNPKVFKRLQPGDCLVKEGKAISAGEVVSFQYTNDRPISLQISSVKC